MGYSANCRQAVIKIVADHFDLPLTLFSTAQSVQERWFLVWNPVFDALKARRFEKIAKFYEERQPWIANERFTTYDAAKRLVEFRSGDIVDARTAAFLSNGETPDPRIEPLGDRMLIDSPHQCKCKYCKCFTPADRPLQIAVDVISLAKVHQETLNRKAKLAQKKQ